MQQGDQKLARAGGMLAMRVAAMPAAHAATVNFAAPVRYATGGSGGP